MKTEKLRYAGSQGYELTGFLDLPEEGTPKAIALFAHCFTCNKHLKAVRNIADALVNEDFGVFRFDFTGLGESEGDFADTNFSSNVDDLISTATFLRSRGQPPSLLIGHSLGGAAVLHAARQIEDIRGVVTIGAPSRPEHVTHHFTHAIDDIRQQGHAEVQLAGRPFTIKAQFVEDLEASTIEASIQALRCALLVMHSPFDQTVGIDNAAQIFQKAKHPKSFISLDQADHLLNDRRDSRYAGGMIAAWSMRYV